MMTNPRGFALLIAILIATVAVTLGVSLLDISYKQVILTSTAKQSRVSFYAADSALECALYYDQQVNAFSYANPIAAASVRCQNMAVQSYNTYTENAAGGPRRVTTFTIPCATGGSNANVTIYKSSSGPTNIYANGYNSCNTSEPRRVERGLKVFY
ncbi:MAG TPA: hypothetical protein VNU47_02740 [Candidatus Paceibacterota bacterium]|nr:hypothetical protein [Candidatus Paceibacterota bacterium]